LVIIGRGRLVADTSVDELISRVAMDRVLVRSRQAGDLRDLLVFNGAKVTSDEPGKLYVSGLTVETISALASERRLTFHELTPQHATLEQAYMELTRDAVEFGDQESREAERNGR
jgi:ABC-2 type transport system ATP-binding protein